MDTPKLIEIHMLQNHSPANLNRDDLGAPKTCIFGDVMRARISSQCLKRSIRRSEAFGQALEGDGGIRTRRLITHLAGQVHGEQPIPEKEEEALIKFIGSIFEEGGMKRTQKGQEPNNTKVILFMPESGIEEMAEVLRTERQRTKEASKRLAERFANILARTAFVPDIALSGRMIELDRKGIFAKMKLGVDAALSAAHAISTHKVVNKTDYFTAADDLPGPTGAAHPDEAQFASACFYKYFSVDWDQLVGNLTPEQADDDAKDRAVQLAACTLGHFLTAAATANPSGKQNSFAAHNPPDGILVEIKDRKVPTSYANAFAEPARRIGQPDDDTADEVSLVGRSIAQLGDYVYNMRRANGSQSTLLWYTPMPWKYPLRGWQREDDGQKKAPVPLVGEERCFAALTGDQDKPGLVEELLREMGFDWSVVKDAGKTRPREVKA